MRVHHLYHVFNVADLNSPQARYDIAPTGSAPGRLGCFASRRSQHTTVDRELVVRHYLPIEINTYPDPPTHDFAFFHQLLGYPHRRLYRDGESDPLDPMWCIYVSCISLTSLTLTTLGITFSTAATIVSSKLAICITSPGKVKCASLDVMHFAPLSRIIICPIRRHSLQGQCSSRTEDVRTIR